MIEREVQLAVEHDGWRARQVRSAVRTAGVDVERVRRGNRALVRGGAALDSFARERPARTWRRAVGRRRARRKSGLIGPKRATGGAALISVQGPVPVRVADLDPKLGSAASNATPSGASAAGPSPRSTAPTCWRSSRPSGTSRRRPPEETDHLRKVIEAALAQVIASPQRVPRSQPDVSGPRAPSVDGSGS